MRAREADLSGVIERDGPLDPAAYTFLEQADDVTAAMDATGTTRATIAGVSDGGVLGAVVAATYPDRVSGALLAAPALWSLGISNPERKVYSFGDELAVDEGSLPARLVAMPDEEQLGSVGGRWPFCAGPACKTTGRDTASVVLGVGQLVAIRPRYLPVTWADRTVRREQAIGEDCDAPD